MRRKIGNKRGPIGLPAFGIAKRIQMKRASVQHRQLAKNTGTAADDLGISNPVARPQIFDADLVELAHPSLLWPLIAKHRAGIEIFQRQALRHAVGDHRADHAGGVFRPQGQGLAPTVSEIIGLLGNNVAAVAKRAREHLGEFEDRGRHFLKAVPGRGTARRVGHRTMRRHGGWQEIGGSPGGL